MILSLIFFLVSNYRFWFFFFFFTLPVLSCENNCDCFLSHGIKVWISKSCRKAGGLDITFRTFSYVFDILKDEKGDKRSPHPLSINSFKLTPFFFSFPLDFISIRNQYSVSLIPLLSLVPSP